jgi:putative tricarboxylic transport membrane protein
LALAVIGAIQYRGVIADAACAVVFGVVGLLMKRRDWPRVPLVIAMSLGLLFETNLHLTLRLQELGRIDFWARPVVLLLLALILFNLFLPALLRKVGALRVLRRGS